MAALLPPGPPAYPGAVHLPESPDTAGAATSPALLTDHYELTMVRAALRSGVAHRRSVFEVFARRLPEGRRYGVVAGTGRLLAALERFRFGGPELEFLLATGVVDQPTADWLAEYRFSGDVYGYAEGECYFPGSPILVVEASFAEAVLLETLVLSVLNHDCAVAAAAARMVGAAGDRPCIEMGSRRTHEEAAVAAARAAYLSGFAATSNLAAGARHGIPTVGTSAHAFTLLHDSEAEAFAAQVATLSSATTLLVDTYDVAQAVRTAVEVAGTDLGAVRLDSGDLLVQAREVREQLDSLGARRTRITVTGDLDEYQIAALAAAPVDGYGVGTKLVTGSGHPAAGLVYKLVARAGSADPAAELLPVAKRSVAKTSRGGRKYAVRRHSEDGVAQAELVGLAAPTGSDRRQDGDRDLLVPLMLGGRMVAVSDAADPAKSVAAARAQHAASRGALPPSAHQLSAGEPAIPTVYLGEQL